MKQASYLLLIIALPILLAAQKTDSIKIIKSDSAVIKNADSTLIKNGDSIQLKSLKFYISNIELVNGDKVVWQQKNSFHLIDASKNESLQIPLKHQSNLNFTKIKFNLGIDSMVNVSGALGGDLDPTKGMYWTWQSGYINFKLEGKSKKCKTRNNEFHFHKNVNLQLSKSSIDCRVYERFFRIPPDRRLTVVFVLEFIDSFQHVTIAKSVKND